MNDGGEEDLCGMRLVGLLLVEACEGSFGWWRGGKVGMVFGGGLQVSMEIYDGLFSFSFLYIGLGE